MVPLIISQRQKLKALKLSQLRPHLIEDLENGFTQEARNVIKCSDNLLRVRITGRLSRGLPMFSRLSVCLIAIMALFIAPAVYGQGNAGITGIVNDSSGGVVPGA